MQQFKGHTQAFMEYSMLSIFVASRFVSQSEPLWCRVLAEDVLAGATKCRVM